MNCPQCGREVSTDAAFCSSCGKDLRQACPGCGQATVAGASFCPGCGAALTSPVAEAGAEAKAEVPLLHGERREATVLFSDLTGYTSLGEALDPEEVAQILAEIKAAATSIIEGHGGTVNQFVGDEVMALFGIPVAHDDDARRAVAAGLELHAFVRQVADRLESLPQPLRMHTGVHTGLVVAEIRDTREGLFTATGDTVNTAARLLAAAGPDELFLGPVTQAETAPYFESEAVGALELKGKSEPLPTYRVVRATDVRSRFELAAGRSRSPLTGRDEEWAALHGALDASASGASCALVIGEAGLGKSRLAHGLCEVAEAEGFRVLRGSCQAFGQVQPYLPFVEATRRFLDVRDRDQPEDIVTRVTTTARELGLTATSQIAVLLHFLSVESDAHPLPASFNPEELPRAIREALAAALRALCARGPVVLHLEDWHWADEASASLLPMLLRDLQDQPVLILVDQRPIESPQWLDLEVETVRLAPLSPTASHALIGSCLGAAEVQPELLALIAARTDGNPLFIEEVCASLLQQGAVVRRGEEVGAIGHIDGLEIPRTIEAVLQSRIDGLPATSRDVLRLASVVGTEVPFLVLERLTPPETSLASHIDRLARFDFLLERGEGADRRLLFRHVSIQQVAYETMLRRERAQIHARVGAVLEELHGGARISETVEALAHHYRLAGNDDKALVYLERAAWKAANSYAYAEAREHFDRAIEILTRGDETDDNLARRRIDLTMRWAEVNLFGPSLEQIPRLESARDRAMALGDAERIVTAQYWIYWVYYAVGEQNRAIEVLEPVLEMVRPSGDDAIIGMMQIGLGHAYAVARDARARPTLEEGLRRRQASRAGSEGVADAHMMDAAGALDTFSECQIALSQGLAGEAEASAQRFRDAIEHVRRTGSLATESSNWITFGLTCLLLGDWQTAVEAAGEARRIAEHMRSPYHLDTSDGIEGYARFQLGDRQRGRTLLQRAVDALERSGMHLSMSLTLATYADVLAELGEAAEARQRAEAALERQRRGERLGTDLALRVLYRLDAASGDPKAAETRRVAMLDEARRQESPRDLALAELEQARACDDPEQRAALRASALASLNSLGLGGFAEALAPFT